MKRTPIIPEYDTIYTNNGGGQYRRADPLRHDFRNCPVCIGWEMDSGYGCWMVNIKSGWTCYCVGIAQYDDATIDWDYSKKGFFA